MEIKILVIIPWQNWLIKSNNTTENTTIAITILKRPIRKERIKY